MAVETRPTEPILSAFQIEDNQRIGDQTRKAFAEHGLKDSPLLNATINGVIEFRESLTNSSSFHPHTKQIIDGSIELIAEILATQKEPDVHIDA